MDQIQQLEKLAELRNKGVLTEEEFLKQKQRILDSSSDPSGQAPRDAADLRDLNDYWRVRFEIFDRAGDMTFDKCRLYKGPIYKNERAISAKEKQRIGFNFLAFIFGPFYYLVKAMWFKGYVILGGAALLSVFWDFVGSALGETLSPITTAGPVALFCGVMANYDYYRFRRYSETTWRRLAPVPKSLAVGCASLLLLLALFTTNLVSPALNSLPINETGAGIYESGDFQISELETERDEFIIYLTGKLRNMSDNGYSLVLVQFAIFDDEGIQIGDTQDTTSNLAGGGIWRFRAPVLEDSVASVKLVNVSAID